MNPRLAILLDGGFVTKALAVKSKLFPTVTDIDAECKRILTHADFKTFDLLRIYYYDAPPATGVMNNPIDGTKVDLGTSQIYARSRALLRDLELLPNFAVRRGETVVRGWKIGDKASKRMLKSPAAPQAHDLVPNIQQKGVDLRIGLDIALLSLKHTVQGIVVVTGDSDLVPAFKFARREGTRVYLDHMGMPVRPELKVHADIVF